MDAGLVVSPDTMSHVDSDQQSEVQVRSATESPAVGIVAGPMNGNEVAGAVLRALDNGHMPLVVPTNPNVEGVRFAQQAGAGIVDVAPERIRAGEAWDELAAAAREAGYPGLYKHADLSKAIDFEASGEGIESESSYVLEPTYEATVMGTPGVLVAIPTYNETGTIGDVVRTALSVTDSVLVVDDGSSDGTVEEARAAGATVIEHERNRGYGGALKTAFAEAKRSGASRLVILDGDGQHDASDIPALLDHQEDSDADIVIGCRFGERSETALPFYRRCGLRVVNLLTNLSLGVVRKRSRIKDTQSGFRVYNRTAIESLADDATIGDHMGASTDILYHAHRHGYSVEEVGTTITYDVENASSQTPVSHGLQLVRNILRTVERERPVTVLGVPGFVSTVVGLGFGYLTFSNFLNSGTFPLGLAMVSIFFALAGIFAAFTAIILHSLETHALQ